MRRKWTQIISLSWLLAPNKTPKTRFFHSNSAKDWRCFGLNHENGLQKHTTATIYLCIWADEPHANATFGLLPKGIQVIVSPSTCKWTQKSPSKFPFVWLLGKDTRWRRLLGWERERERAFTSHKHHWWLIMVQAHDRAAPVSGSRAYKRMEEGPCLLNIRVKVGPFLLWELMMLCMHFHERRGKD